MVLVDNSIFKCDHQGDCPRSGNDVRQLSRQLGEMTAAAASLLASPAALYLPFKRLTDRKPYTQHKTFPVLQSDTILTKLVADDISIEILQHSVTSFDSLLLSSGAWV